MVDAPVRCLGSVAGQPDGLGAQARESLIGPGGGGDDGGHAGESGAVRQGGFGVCRGAGRGAELIASAGKGECGVASLGAEGGAGGAVPGADGDDPGPAKRAAARASVSDGGTNLSPASG